MKGAVYLGEGRLEVREFPQPEPGPDEALIRMAAAGLCGSDLHKYHKSRQWAARRKGMISGHEPAGVVAGLGSGVDNVSVGDRVCVYHSIGCGRCRYCLSGTPVFCSEEGAFGRTRDGCHADFMTTPARYCLPLPDEIPFSVGAMLACTAGTAYASLRKCRLDRGETLVVFGLGPVGLTVLLMANALGYRCIGVDVNPYRVNLAKALRAGVVVNAGAADPVKTILELTSGKGAAGILECSGSAAARSQTARVAALHGRIVIVGAGDAEMNLEPIQVIEKELTIRGNSVYSVREYFDTVDFVRTHRLPLEDLITHRFRIEQAPEAFALFDRGDTGKVVFEWETP